MKLSEAILLGSTMLAPKAGGQHFAETQSGCALGMAAIARGCTFVTNHQPFAERDRRTLGTEGIWGEWVLLPVVRPCDCWRLWTPRTMRIKDIIAHLFDSHVMRKKDWDLKRLVAWVETVEPKQPSSSPKPIHVFGDVITRWPLQAEEFRKRKQAATDREAEEQWLFTRLAFEARHAKRHSC